MKMGRAVEEWTDARLNDLAAALEPIPVRVAVLAAAVEHLGELATTLQPLPAQVAVLTTTVDRLAEENRALREELAATHRQLVTIAWGLVGALIGAAAALVAALV
jgi:outer membrane murein-binding lipoprotein Lpp